MDTDRYTYQYDPDSTAVSNVDLSHEMDYNGARLELRNARSVDYLRKVPHGITLRNDGMWEVE